MRRHPLILEISVMALIIVAIAIALKPAPLLHLLDTYLYSETNYQPTERQKYEFSLKTGGEWNKPIPPQKSTKPPTAEEVKNMWNNHFKTTEEGAEKANFEAWKKKNGY